MATCACGYQIRFSHRFSVCINFCGSPKQSKEDLELPMSRALVYGTFCLIGLGLNVVWGAISFQAALWDSNEVFMMGTWSLMIVLYNTPGLLVLIAQLLTDEWFEKNFRPSSVWAARVFVSLLLCCLCTSVVPFLFQAKSRPLLLAFTALVGIIIGLAHGWLYSFAALFPGSKPTSFLLIGGGLSTIFLAGLQAGVNVTAKSQIGKLFEYYYPALGLGILALIFAFAFALHPKTRAHVDNRTLSRPSSSQSPKKSVSINGDNETDGNEGQLLLRNDEDLPAADLESKAAEETPKNWSLPRVARLTRVAVFKKTFLCQLSIFLNTWLQIASISLVTMMPKEPNTPYEMTTVLMWATAGSAFVGNEIQSFLAPIKSPAVLLVFCIVHFLMFPFVIVYAVGKFWVNNIFTIAYMIVMSGTNGYLISDCYRLSAVGIPPENSTEAQIMMNLALYFGIYVAVTTPYWLMPIMAIFNHKM